MAKTTIGMLLAMLAAFMVTRYAPSAAPNGIRVVLPTEQSVKEEMKNEHRAQAYKNASRAAAQVYRRNGCRSAIFAEATGRVAVDYGLSSRVLAALVFVESSCNPKAGFNHGQASVGLTQVNTIIWRLPKDSLKDPEISLRTGASILAGYIRKYGLKEGLHHYNGMGDASDSYSNKILTAAGLMS